jgi:hypothetical protein
MYVRCRKILKIEDHGVDADLNVTYWSFINIAPLNSLFKNYNFYLLRIIVFVNV